MLVTQLCPTLCDPRTAAHQAPLSMGILQARMLEWVARHSSRGIFPAQGLNPGLPPCRQILHSVSYLGHPCLLRAAAKEPLYKHGGCWPGLAPSHSGYRFRWETYLFLLQLSDLGKRDLRRRCLITEREQQ